MREYARISPQFWIGTTGKAIRRLGIDCQIVALYLMTSPHSNMLGLYYLPIVYIASDTGLTIEGASKALARLSEAHFCTYDDASEMVWVHEMAFYQIADELSPKDKQVQGINKTLKTLPKCPQIKGFYEKYKAAFHLEYTSPSEAPYKPLRSKEKEQEKEQDTDTADVGGNNQQATVVPIKPEQQLGEAGDLATLGEANFARLVAEQHAKAFGLPRAVPVGMQLGSLVTLRAQSYWPAQSGDWWLNYFEHCAADDFLNGTKNPKFKADLVYLLDEKTFGRVIEASQKESANG